MSRSFIYCTIVLSFVAFITTAQTSRTAKFSGYVKNNWTYEGAIGVNIYIESLGIGTSTDVEGYFEMEVPKGTFRVQFTSIEMQTESKLIDITKDVELEVFMKEKQLSLQAVTIYSQAQDVRVKSLDVGKNSLDIEKISSLPSFMGEVDVVRSLILLPGVSTVGEGTSGFNVRGGSVDQNLILQDGAIIFNPSHVFGFFSVFNPGVLDNSTLYKSGVPAAYGGRLSSVLDVKLREGDYQDYHMNAGVGIVASNLAVDGPIIKDKLSFVLGGRISYSDWMLKAAQASEFANSTAFFWDGNAKLSWIINKNNKLSYSGYSSSDGFGFASDTTFNWRTNNHSLHYQHIFNEKSVINTTLVSGKYDYDIEDESGIDAFNIASSIKYASLKSVFRYDYTASTKFNAGIESTHYQFNPGEQQPYNDDSGVEYLKIEEERSLESAIFAEAEFKITPKLSIRPGVRFSTFQNFGPGTDYTFSGERDMDNVADTLNYGAGEVIQSYSGVEPRLNINYLITPQSSIKFSYNRQRQYLHLISNTAAVTPTDFWKTSNKYISPQVGDQYSLGYFHNFLNNVVEVSVETYYKTATDIVDFKNGSKLLMNDYIEADLLNGTAESYGAELMVNKKSGRLTGWMGYTYARTFRTVKELNKGNPYPANFDKPHDITFAVNYEPNPIVKYGFNFNYSTGRPVTVPLGAYNVSNLTNIFNYSLRNEQRIPDYHRLDFSLTLKSKPKIDRKWKMSWTFAIYNLYGHKNAYSVFFENNYQQPPRAYKLSILGSPFPSITMNFKL